MAVLTPSGLLVIILFMFARSFDSVWSVLHRFLFSHLHFYLWPSDHAIRSLLPKSSIASLAVLPSKVRKRLAKRAGLAADAFSMANTMAAASGSESVQLQLATISTNLFAKAGSSTWQQLHSYCALQFLLVLCVFVEQGWICYRTTNNVPQPDGTVLAVEMNAAVTSPTLVLLFGALIYNLWIGVSILSRAQNAAGAEAAAATSTLASSASAAASPAASNPTVTKYWYRTTFGIGFLMFLLSMFLQSMRGSNTSVTASFLSADSGIDMHATSMNCVTVSLQRCMRLSHVDKDRHSKH